MWTFIVFFYCASMNVDALIKIPLRNRNEEQNTSTTNHLVKRGIHLNPLNVQPLLIYYLEITIGTPPQTFTVFPDTGSTLSWVPGIKCTDKNSGCFKHRKFDPSSSTSYKSSILGYKIAYGTGHISGQYASDVVNIAGLNVKKQQFGITQSDSGKPFTLLVQDGILGLSSNNKKESIIRNLYDQKLIEKFVFSYYLNSIPNAPNQGFLILGGSDRSLYKSDMFYTAVDDKKNKNSHWKVPLNSMRIGCKEFASQKVLILFDTGSNDIAIDGPNRVNLKQALGIPYRQNIIPCEKVSHLPTIEFSIGGKTFSLDGPDYVMKIAGECVFRIDERSMKRSDMVWLFGTPFFRKYYTEFDFANHRIGFATSRPIP